MLIKVDRSFVVDDDDSWNPWGEEFERKGWHKPHPLPLEPFDRPREEARITPGKKPDEPGEPGDEIDDLIVKDGDHVIEIWGKAAIGDFLLGLHDCFYDRGAVI